MSFLPEENFDNRFTRDLPGDSNPNNTPRQVLGACWSPVVPTPVSAPQVLAVSEAMADRLDLSVEEVMSPISAQVFSGNHLLPGMFPYAACYGGHQFGNWAGQLGDGRAIHLGEYLNRRGERWDLQLKGAGPTPYSRTADGRAVLRSSLREFVCSEAMAALGVPTTRALTLVDTGESVIRDMLYDGHPQRERGAIVCRVAPSFIRFGNFEILAARGDHVLLERLVDFTINRDFSRDVFGDQQEKRTAWFHLVCERTADLIAHWMRVGFVHGVMNTDNMSILGLTIDYGPYGWIDNYDPNWTPNTTDREWRRYRFGEQANVALWNLACLANALLPIFKDEAPLRAGLDLFRSRYQSTSQTMTDAKFGFSTRDPQNDELAQAAYALLLKSNADMTCFFRDLGEISLEAPTFSNFDDMFYDRSLQEDYKQAWNDWLHRYVTHLKQVSPHVDPRARQQAMNAVNPRYVPRNYLLQEAIDRAEAGDVSRLHQLMRVLQSPYDEQEEHREFAEKRPDWALNRVGCSMLSCSS